MQELVNLTSQTIGDVRDLIRDMSSYSLQHLGIESAIRNLIRTYEQHTELAIHFQTWITLKDEKSIPPPVALSVFRIVQEGINNIIKHARATHVTVQLTELPDAFLLMIEDDGIGFDYPEKKRSRDSYGLQNMAERCLVLNAELDIDSKPGHGCTINIRIPKSKKPDPYDYAS
jgi:signal transduction histidine kinase